MAKAVKKTFAEIKSLSLAHNLPMQVNEDKRAYHVFVVDEAGTNFQANIYKTSFLNDHRVIGIDEEQNALDETDFVDNYKAVASSNIVQSPKTDDHREFIYTTSRPVGTHTYFTSEGDDTSSYKNIGGGAKLQFSHNVGDPINYVYCDFNVLDNDTYVHEGYVSYVDCNFDQLSFHFVPKTTSYVASSDTTFNLFGGYLVIPAAGDGTIQLTETPNLVEAGKDLYGNPNPGFWDADFNYETGVFDNLTPNPTGQGKYNIFGEEIILYRMIQKIILVGTGEKYLETSEHGKLFHGYRLKIICDVENPDHDFKISGILVLYRSKVGNTTR